MDLYLLYKIVISLFYVPCKNELTKNYKVSAIITCFNESSESVLRVCEDLLKQDYSLYEIIFIDDGSSDTQALNVVDEFAQMYKDVEGKPKFIVHRQEKNEGKRVALAVGFTYATGDYFLLVDSDCQLNDNAVTELLRPFEDEKVFSCTGYIGVRNSKVNFLTRMQEVMYCGAFQMGRGAQSVTNSVVVCSGAFSMHRRDFVRQHLEEFSEEYVMGFRVMNGDDRVITRLAKKYGGKTKYQCTAFCVTDVPETVNKFLKQRVRWMKSSYLRSVETVVVFCPKCPLYLIWITCEAYLWVFLLDYYVYYLSNQRYSYKYFIRPHILYFN